MLSPKAGARDDPSFDVNGVFDLGTATGGAFIVLPIIDALFIDITKAIAAKLFLAL